MVIEDVDEHLFDVENLLVNKTIVAPPEVATFVTIHAEENHDEPENEQPKKWAKKGLADPKIWCQKWNKILREKGKVYTGIEKITEGSTSCN